MLIHGRYYEPEFRAWSNMRRPLANRPSGFIGSNEEEGKLKECIYKGCDFPDGNCKGECQKALRQIRAEIPAPTPAGEGAPGFLRRAAEIMEERGRNLETLNRALGLSDSAVKPQSAKD